MRRPGWLGGIGWLAAWLIVPTSGWASDPDGLAFFEQKIRPILVQECYNCHSAGAKKLKGGLLLDSRAGLLAGGDSGPAVVPGKPAESFLLDALRYDGIEMPPKGKLPENVVADFRRWIEMGAPDPRDGKPTPARGAIDLEAGRKFWSYQPPRHHPSPDVADTAWPKGEIDRFLLATLESKGIRPVRDADRSTLARRVYYDLVGLPPTPEQLDEFLDDPRPDAYEKFVDQLLASPQFGERWGRHWLDVVRFGESLTLRGFVLKEAWRYRDYVIEAFNADMPFDQFVREQVAGDLLPGGDLADRRRKLTATTFLALGNNNLEEQDKPQLVMDIVDEQLDTIGKAFLAQTIGCARCHDHKFDPIPTRDYYAMAGILRNSKTVEHANVSKWIERPLPESPEREAEIVAHESAVKALEARVKEARTLAKAGGKARGGVIAAADLPGIVVDDSRAKAVGEWMESQFSKTYIGTGYRHDINAGKGDKTLTFVPDLSVAGKYEVRLAYSPGGNRSAAVPVTVFSADGEKTLTVDMRSSPPIEGRFLSLGQYQFEQDGQGFVLISNEGTTGHVVADAVAFVPVESLAKAPAESSSKEEEGNLRKLEAEFKQLRANGPRREMVLSVVEEAEISNARVHVRGSVHNLGESAPRGFLQVATTGEVPPMPSGESGRKEFADWLAEPGNPLTARVIVNRAWHWLFGSGLVRTVDNFGTTGETPSHPELLDDLASRFMQEDWSIKALVRQIVLSHAYQLSDDDSPEAQAIDPENRLLWRMNRRRLDAECIRDTILAVSGQLDPDRGGPGFPDGLSVDYGYQSESTRRSVYVPVFRNALPEIFEAFDFADPSMVVGRRNVSTVAPQALFLLNHSFVTEQARHAARRLLSEPDLDLSCRIDRAYRRTLGRLPSDAERSISREFLAEDESEEAWATLFQALFGSADFRYVN